MLNVTEELHVWPYMVMQNRCVWNKTFILGNKLQFSWCFYIHCHDPQKKSYAWRIFTGLLQNVNWSGTLCRKLRKYIQFFWSCIQYWLNTSFCKLLWLPIYLRTNYSTLAVLLKNTWPQYHCSVLTNQLTIIFSFRVHIVTINRFMLCYIHWAQQVPALCPEAIHTRVVD